MLVARSCDWTVVPLNIYVSLALTAARMRVWYKKSDEAHFCLLFSLLVAMYAAFSVHIISLYNYSTISVSFSLALLFSLLVAMYGTLSLYNYSTVLFYYSVDGRHTTRTRPGKPHTATGRCPGQRTPHALVAYAGIDEERTVADRRHPPARPWGWWIRPTVGD